MVSFFASVSPSGSSAVDVGAAGSCAAFSSRSAIGSMERFAISSSSSSAAAAAA